MKDRCTVCSVGCTVVSIRDGLAIESNRMEVELWACIQIFTTGRILTYSICLYYVYIIYFIYTFLEVYNKWPCTRSASNITLYFRQCKIMNISIQYVSDHKWFRQASSKQGGKENWNRRKINIHNYISCVSGLSRMACWPVCNYNNCVISSYYWRFYL